MLKEMRSPAFRKDGKERPPIVFHKGLNVVLGMENGKNSIGKSSAMQAIDFVFGGSTYIKGDGVKHVGHHTVFFTFEFDGQEYRFARNTGEPDIIQVCTDGYVLTGETKGKSEFVEWLKEKYSIDYPGLSFRSTLSSFFRMHGKSNVSAQETPLYGVRGDSMQKSLDRLVKLFDRYKDIEAFNSKLKEQDDKLSAYRAAQKYQFVSDLVGGDKQYEANAAKIRSLQEELDNLTSEQVEVYSEEDIEKQQQKAELRGRRLKIETQIEAKQRRLKLLEMSLEYGLYPSQADLQSLQEFFPDVNIRKLYEVENYHRKLARILDDQFASERQAVLVEIEDLEEQRKEVNEQIKVLGFVGNISKEFLDRHSELKGTIDALKKQNESYLTLRDLKEAKKLANDQLKNAIRQILSDIEQTINAKMTEYNDTLYAEHHNPPKLTIKEYNSFTFETKGDDGTAAAYKGMIIYDLAVLNITGLPAIAHDSLLYGDLGFKLVEGIMKLYEQNEKQIFISFDKQSAHTSETQRILESHTVLKLADGDGKLYGQSWDIETEDES